MADKNIQMTQRNISNNGWDSLYPITKASNVIGIESRKYSMSVGSGSTASLNIVFDKAFSEPPVVVLSAQTASPNLYANVSYTSVTTTGFTINVYNGNTGSQITAYGNWAAIGK